MPAAATTQNKNQVEKLGCSPLQLPPLGPSTYAFEGLPKTTRFLGRLGRVQCMEIRARRAQRKDSPMAVFLRRLRISLSPISLHPPSPVRLFNWAFWIDWDLCRHAPRSAPWSLPCKLVPRTGGESVCVGCHYYGTPKQLHTLTLYLQSPGPPTDWVVWLRV